MEAWQPTPSGATRYLSSLHAQLRLRLFGTHRPRLCGNTGTMRDLLPEFRSCYVPYQQLRAKSSVRRAGSSASARGTGASFRMGSVRASKRAGQLCNGGAPARVVGAALSRLHFSSRGENKIRDSPAEEQTADWRRVASCHQIKLLVGTSRQVLAEPREGSASLLSFSKVS